MALLLLAHSTFAKEPSSVPSSHAQWLTTAWNSSSRVSNTFSDLSRHYSDTDLQLKIIRVKHLIKIVHRLILRKCYSINSRKDTVNGGWINREHSFLDKCNRWSFCDRSNIHFFIPIFWLVLWTEPWTCREAWLVVRLSQRNSWNYETKFYLGQRPCPSVLHKM